MRGLAALGVVGFHYRQVIPENLSPDRVTGFFERAYIFVDLFFILSGFVLAYVYSSFFSGAPAKSALKQFFVHRVARIYPLHLATLLFMLLLLGANVLAQGGSLPPIGEILRNFLMVHAWGFSESYLLNYPSWSISAEFAVYLLFPVFAVFLRGPFRQGAMIVLIIAGYGVLAAHSSSLQLGATFNLLRALLAFPLGILLYQYRGRLPDTVSPSAFQMISALLIIMVMHLRLSDYWLIPAFALLVLAMWKDEGMIARALNQQWLHALGLWSYAIYMLHVPLATLTKYYADSFGFYMYDGLNSYVFVVVNMALLIPLSAFVYMRFEKPAREWLRRRLRQI